MERLNDSAQWLVLLGFLISAGIFFLAVIVNESIIVGQTTAESVLTFPKADILDIRSEIIRTAQNESEDAVIDALMGNITNMTFQNKHALITITSSKGITNGRNYRNISMKYNNGATLYYEVIPYIFYS